MSFALGYEREMKLLAETNGSWGTTPSSALTKFLVTGGSIKHVNEEHENDEIYTDGQKGDNALISEKGIGSMPFNVRFCDVMHELLLFSVGAASWSSTSIAAATDIAFNADDNALSSTVTDFCDNSMTVGQIIKLSGDQGAGNAGLGMITAIAQRKLTLSADWLDLDVEAAGDEVTIAGDYCRNATTLNSHTVEEEYTESTEFKYGEGFTIESLALTIEAGSIVKGDITFMGEKVTMAGTTSGTGSETAASTITPFLANAGINKVYLDNAVLTSGTQKFNINISRNLIPKTELTSNTMTTIGIGQFTVTIDIGAYFEDSTEYDIFKARTPKRFDIVMVDAAGNYYCGTMFRGIAADVPEMEPSIEDPIIVEATINSSRSTSPAKMWQWTKIAA